MSRFWPHPPYAEDQPHAHTILTTHVSLRALTTGALLSSTYTTIRQLTPYRLPHFPRRLVLNAGAGGLWIQPLIGIALVGRMWGRDEIEWQDRSWRLLENQGQVECDDWTLAGMVLAPAAWAATGMGKGLRGTRWVVAMVGSSALGSVAGMGGYMAWRYGVVGGKFPVKREIAV